MNGNPRLTSLNSAAGLYILRRSFGSAGTSSILWALVWFGIAAVRFSHDGLDGVVLGFGLVAVALLAEGIYVLRSWSRSALTCEAVTLALLAALDLSAFVLHVNSKGSSGRPPNPLIGMFMGFNAWKTWSARKAFTSFSESTTEADLEHVESVIKATLSSDPKTASNLVQLKRTGLSNYPNWRIWFDPEFAYLINLRTFFGRTRPLNATVCERSSLRFEVTGEKWLGNARKLKLTADGDTTAVTYEISPEMLEKLSNATGIRGMTIHG